MKAALAKFTVIMLMLAALAAVFCGCAETKKKDDVKLKTVMEAKDYIKKQRLPAAKYVKTEEESDDKAVYVFMDSECEFKFNVTTEKYKKEMEGADLGWAEKTTDDWAKCYCRYIDEKLKATADELASTMGFTYEYYDDIDGTVYMAVFTDKSGSDVESSVKALADIIKSEDKHGKFTHKQIWVWNGEKDKDYNNLTGCYLIEEGRLVDKKTSDEYVSELKDSSSK